MHANTLAAFRQALVQQTKYAWLAISFLTRLPVPDLGTLVERDFGHSALYYPLVGLILGGLLCVPLLVFPHAAPFLLAAMISVMWAMLTGGLHLDGVADSADAWLGGLGNVEKTHRILKDPLVGAAGAIAISSVLLLKCAALSALIAQGQWQAVLFAPIIGRCLILLIFLTTPYVRAGGLASAVTTYLPRKIAWILIISGLSAAFMLSISGTLAALWGAWSLRNLMLARIQGCTGDTAGATVEIGEMLWLVGFALNLS